MGRGTYGGLEWPKEVLERESLSWICQSWHKEMIDLFSKRRWDELLGEGRKHKLPVNEKREKSSRISTMIISTMSVVNNLANSFSKCDTVCALEHWYRQLNHTKYTIYTKPCNCDWTFSHCPKIIIAYYKGSRGHTCTDGKISGWCL